MFVFVGARRDFSELVRERMLESADHASLLGFALMAAKLGVCFLKVNDGTHVPK